MKAIKRVKDSNQKTVGFILEDGVFYTDYYISQHIGLITNLKQLNNGVIKCNIELPIISYRTVINKWYKELVRNNLFIRDIQKDLINWKKSSLHKILQLEGSRQIGKTTELLKFGYKNYEYVIYVNLSNDTFNFVNRIIQNGVYPLTLEDYCINANLPHYVNSKKTLLILDEIQMSSQIYNTLRDMNSRLNCDIIVTGSYLGQTLKLEYFQPMGTVEYLKMFPLSFKEFCRIFKQKDVMLSQIDLYGNCNENEYTQLLSLYEVYRQIGGYPEVIKQYIKDKSINNCGDVIENLLNTFEKESRNYFKNSKETLIFNTVYTQAMHEMCLEKRGSGSKLIEIVTNLVKDSQKILVSRDEVSRAIQWLIYSGILGECNLCNNGDINDIQPARRLYYMDCGIANYIARQTGIVESNIEGMLTETFVYSELNRLYNEKSSKRKVKGKVPCFSVLNNYELDFMLLSSKNIIYGIEVKTNTGDLKSLKVFVDKKLVNKGIVAKKTKGGHNDKFDTIPIFAVGARFPYINLES